MNKLELIHINQFLPFGLQLVINEEASTRKIVYPVDVIGYECVSPGNVTFKVFDNGIKFPFYVNDQHVKANLRPLTDLVKENKETGKPFFIEVLKASCEMPFEGKNNKFWKPTFTGDTQREHHPDKSTYLEIDNLYNDYSFSIDLTNGDLSTYRNGELATTDNQANYFRELARLHFDTDNLIGKGLAIAKQ